jgi:hypothetical protein
MAEFRFVEHLPDLIEPVEYPNDPKGRMVKMRLRADDQSVEILGDAARATNLESLLEEMEVEVIERMLCG